MKPIEIIKNRYFVGFIISFIMILVEFYYIGIKTNNYVLLFALFGGLFFMGVIHGQKNGKLHFGVMLFFLGFLMVLFAGIPLLGSTQIGPYGNYWQFDESGNQTPISSGNLKIMLAVTAFAGGVMMFVNFKAYMKNWIFIRPMGGKSGKN